MHISNLTVANFKGFAAREFLLHPQFNLVIGENGTGKTSVLDALSIAAGSWFLGLRGYDTRHIRPEEVLLNRFETKHKNGSKQPPSAYTSDLTKHTNSSVSRAQVQFPRLAAI